ncbi:Hypothetical protein SRAE_2000121200 [Strongyloides ratti]|uniref:Uncharacterized protein n=1 Tax=Strongyloides ratti TaxID=34506 RepID=A0A090MY45_STRRB|nr:Hypothetical protein SRAE_2000121200 [Strongyloides ratti]CEF66544.1 Hypothetical protein SRAE_2000121200 [Strongyloides ratti]
MRLNVPSLLLLCSFICLVKCLKVKQYNPLKMRDFLIDSYKKNYKYFNNPMVIVSAFSTHIKVNNPLPEILNIEYCEGEKILILIKNLQKTTFKKRIIIREKESQKVVDKKNYKVIDAIDEMYLFLNFTNLNENNFIIQMAYDPRLQLQFFANKFKDRTNYEKCNSVNENVFMNNEVFISNPFNVKHDDTTSFIICSLKRPNKMFNLYFQYFNNNTGEFIKIKNDNTFFNNLNNDFITMIIINEELVTKSTLKVLCVVEYSITKQKIAEVSTLLKPTLKEDQWIYMEKDQNVKDNNIKKNSNFKDFFAIFIICVISVNLFGRKVVNLIKKIFSLITVTSYF